MDGAGDRRFDGIVPQTQDEASGSLPDRPGARAAGPALVYFAKVPVAGRVKTRLCPPLTPAEAAGLYRGFLADVLRPFDGVRGYVYAWPETEFDAMRGLVPEELDLRPQRGEGLWQRMQNCFDELFAAGHDRVVLRGTDSPDVPRSDIERALARSGPGRVVLGPDPGGGYYLVGLGAPRPELFGVALEGGATVFDATCAAVRSAGLELEILPEHRDVDDYDDLIALWSERT